MKTFAYLLLLVLLAFIVLEEANAEASNDQQPQSDQPRKKGQYFRTWNVRDKKKISCLFHFASLNSLGIQKARLSSLLLLRSSFLGDGKNFTFFVWCVFHSDCVQGRKASKNMSLSTLFSLFMLRRKDILTSKLLSDFSFIVEQPKNCPQGLDAIQFLRYHKWIIFWARSSAQVWWGRIGTQQCFSCLSLYKS